jgi:hypothetical protein
MMWCALLISLLAQSQASPRIPGVESSGPREAISEEESLDDFDPFEGMVLGGRLQASCVFENVRPGLSFVVYQDDAWLRPSVAEDRKLVTRDDHGMMWRVDFPREQALGGIDDKEAYLLLKGERTVLRWNQAGHVIILLAESEMRGPVEATLVGTSGCSRSDSILAAGAYWYWIAHRVSLGSEEQ